MERETRVAGIDGPVVVLLRSGCVPDPGVVEVGGEISLNRSDAVFDAIVGDGADSGDVGDDGDDGANVGRAQENDEKESDSGDRDGSWSEFLEGCENEDGVQGRGLERMEVGDGGGGGGVEKEAVTEGNGLEDKEEEEDEEEEEEEEEEVEVEKEGRNGEKEEEEEGEGEGQDEEIGVDMVSHIQGRIEQSKAEQSRSFLVWARDIPGLGPAFVCWNWWIGYGMG